MAYITRGPTELGGNPLISDERNLNGLAPTEFGANPAGLDLAGMQGQPLGLQAMSPRMSDAQFQQGITAMTTGPLMPATPTAPSAGIYYSPSTGDMIVNGFQFNQRNASQALQSVEFARQPRREFTLPDTATDWREMSPEEYTSYLDEIQNPSVVRRLGEGWEHAWRGFGDVAIGAGNAVAELTGNEWEWGNRARENLVREYEENAPFMLRLRDVDNVVDGLLYAAQMVEQGIPWIAETIVSMAVGGVVGAAATGGLGAPEGAVAGFLAKEGLRRATMNAVSRNLARGARAFSQARITGTPLTREAVTEYALRNRLASADDVNRFFTFGERAFEVTRTAAIRRGQFGAMVGSNYMTGVGDIRNSIQDAGGDPDTADAIANIWGGAIPYALMESLGDLVITQPLTGLFPELAMGATRGGNALRFGAMGAGAEGLEEGAQYLITQNAVAGATNEEINIEPMDLLESVVGGALAGGGIGALTGAIGNPNRPAEPTTTTPTTPTTPATGPSTVGPRPGGMRTAPGDLAEMSAGLQRTRDLGEMSAGLNSIRRQEGGSAYMGAVQDELRGMPPAMPADQDERQTLINTLADPNLTLEQRDAIIQALESLQGGRDPAEHNYKSDRGVTPVEPVQERPFYPDNMHALITQEEIDRLANTTTPDPFIAVPPGLSQQPAVGDDVPMEIFQRLTDPNADVSREEVQILRDAVAKLYADSVPQAEGGIQGPNTRHTEGYANVLSQLDKILEGYNPITDENSREFREKYPELTQHLASKAVNEQPLYRGNVSPMEASRTRQAVPETAKNGNRVDRSKLKPPVRLGPDGKPIVDDGLRGRTEEPAEPDYIAMAQEKAEALKRGPKGKKKNARQRKKGRAIRKAQEEAAGTRRPGFTRRDGMREDERRAEHDTEAWLEENDRQRMAEEAQAVLKRATEEKEKAAFAKRTRKEKELLAKNFDNKTLYPAPPKNPKIKGDHGSAEVLPNAPEEKARFVTGDETLEVSWAEGGKIFMPAFTYYVYDGTPVRRDIYEQTRVPLQGSKFGHDGVFRKKAGKTFLVTRASEDGNVKTLESPVNGQNYKAGELVFIGVVGERWNQSEAKAAKSYELDIGAVVDAKPEPKPEPVVDEDNRVERAYKSLMAASEGLKKDAAQTVRGVLTAYARAKRNGTRINTDKNTWLIIDGKRLSEEEVRAVLAKFPERKTNLKKEVPEPTAEELAEVKATRYGEDLSRAWQEAKKARDPIAAFATYLNGELKEVRVWLTSDSAKTMRPGLRDKVLEALKKSGINPIAASSTGEKVTGLGVKRILEIASKVNRLINPKTKMRSLHVFDDVVDMIARADKVKVQLADGSEHTLRDLAVHTMPPLEPGANVVEETDKWLARTFDRARATVVPFYDALFVFNDRIKDEDTLLQTLEHEYIAHYGLRALFKDDASRYLFLKRVGSLPGIEELRVQLLHIAPQYRAYNYYEQIEEVIAFHAEQGPLAVKKLLSAPEGIDQATRRTLWEDLLQMTIDWINRVFGGQRTKSEDVLDNVVAALREHAIVGQWIDLHAELDARGVATIQELGAATDAKVVRTSVTKAVAPGKLPRRVIDGKFGKVIVNPTQADLLKETRRQAGKAEYETDTLRYIRDKDGNMFVGNGYDMLHDNIASTVMHAGIPLQGYVFEHNDRYGTSHVLQNGHLQRQGNSIVDIPTEIPFIKYAVAVAGNPQDTTDLLLGLKDDPNRPYAPKPWHTDMVETLIGNAELLEKITEANKATGTSVREALRKAGRNMEPMNNMATRSTLIEKMMDIMHNTIGVARHLMSKRQETRKYAENEKTLDRWRAFFGDTSPGSTKAERDAYGRLAIAATINKLAQTTEAVVRTAPRLLVRGHDGMYKINIAVFRRLLRQGTVSKAEFEAGLTQYIVSGDGEAIAQGTANLSQKTIDDGYKIYLSETRHMAESKLETLEALLTMLNRKNDAVIERIIYDNAFSPADQAFVDETLRRMYKLYSDIAFAGPQTSFKARAKQAAKARQVLVELMRTMHKVDKLAEWVDTSMKPKDTAKSPRKENAFKWREQAKPEDDVKPFVAQINWFLQADPSTGLNRLDRMHKIYNSEKGGRQYAMLGAFQNMLNTETLAKETENDVIQSVLGNYVELTRSGDWRVAVVAHEMDSTPDKVKLAQINPELYAKLPVTYPKSEREAKALQELWNETFGGTHTILDDDGEPKQIKFDIVRERAPGISTLVDPPSIREFLEVAELVGLALSAPQMKQIANLVANAAERKRFGLQRAGTPGMDANILKNNSETLTRRAWYAAKLSQAWMLDDVFNDKRNVKGDWGRLAALQEAFDIANRGAPEGKPVPAGWVRNEDLVYITETALLRYAHQLRHMAEHSVARPTVNVRTTKGEQKLKIEGEGNIYLEHAKALKESLEKNELELNLNDILSKTGPLRMMAVVMQLGSIASGIMNAFTLITHLPWVLMAAHTKTGYGEGFSFSEITAEIMRAATQVGKVWGNLPDSVTVKRMLDAAKAGDTSSGLTIPELEFLYQETLDGLLMPQQTYSMTGGTESSIPSLILRNLIKGLLTPFSSIEAAVRRISALVTYRLAKARYQRAGLSEEKLNDLRSPEAKQLTKDVQRVVWNAQGDYANINRPKTFRGDLGQYVLMYKMFPLITQIMIWNLPIKQQAMVLGVLFLLGGLKGEPFAEDFMDIYDTLLQKLGFRHDSLELTLVQALEDVQPGLSKWVMSGGIDALAFGGTMSTRVSMGDIIPFTGAFREGADLNREIEAAFGPAYAANKAALEWAWLATDYSMQVLGIKPEVNSLEDLIRKFPQSQFRAAGEAAMMAATGQITDPRGRLVSDEVDVFSVFTRFLGFYPLEATHANQAVRLDRMHSGYMKAIRARFILAYANAYRAGDNGRMERISREVADWNESVRHTGQDDMLINGFRAAATRAGRAASQTTIERTSSSAPDYSVIDEVAAALNADTESDD